MGKGLTSAQIAQLAGSTAKTRRLITIELDTPIRILENDSTGSITINENTYYTKLVQTSDVQGSLDGNSEKMDIIISDVSQEFAGLITDDEDALTNKTCTIEQVIFNGDEVDVNGNPVVIDTTILLFKGLINNLQLASTYCAFSVEKPLYSYSTVSPNMTYDINCQFKFMDSRCGYTGAETKCDKTKTRCQALGRIEYFGGYPSVTIPFSTK